jgi:hypothetical protein
MKKSVTRIMRLFHAPTNFSFEPLDFKFVQFRQVFGLHRFKLHRHLVDSTESVWFRQVLL